MDEDLLSPEDEQEQTKPPEIHFATVGAVYSDGVSLIFDGETEASEKHYKVNTSIVFHAGDRMKIASDAGTYVCEYVVGNPGATAPHELPSGGSTGQALVKSSNSSWATAWKEIIPAKIENEIWTANDSYVLQLRTTSIAGTPVFQIRRGLTGTWYTIATS